MAYIVNSVPKMASAIDKICGVCSKPIVDGYMTFGVYYGTIVCIYCLSKNTWTMCRKCNGTLTNCQDTTPTIPANASVSETEELLTVLIAKLKSELERIQAINRLADSIAQSSELKCEDLQMKIDNQEKEYPDVIMELKRKDQRQTNPGKYISLIPTVPQDVPTDGIPEQQITLPEYRVSCDKSKHCNYELILRVHDSKLLLVIHEKRYAKRINTYTYNLSREYAEIVARSGQPCAIGFVSNPKYTITFGAIKTLDGNIHILYCGKISFPYEPSRYVDYVQSPLPLGALSFEVSDAFIDEKTSWHFMTY